MLPFTSLPPVVAVPDWPQAAPLLHGLAARADISLSTLPAHRIADALDRQACACALASPTLLLANPALSVLPGAGLVAEGPTPGERLVSPQPLDRIRRVRVRAGAEPLVPYVQVLFAERGLVQPEFAPELPGPNEAGCGLLTSGRVDEDTPESGHDLGMLWRECTGLPMVLGVWVCTGTAPYRLLRQVLGEAARFGEMAMARETPCQDRASAENGYYYRVLSLESDSIRVLHSLARRHAIGGAIAESIVFC